MAGLFLAKKVSRVIIVKPLYVLLINTVMLFSAGLITLLAVPDFNRTYRNYQLIGIEVFQNGNKLQEFNLQENDLVFKLQPKDGNYQFRSTRHTKMINIPQQITGLIDDSFVVLHREAFSGEIVVQSAGINDSLSVIRCFLAKMKCEPSK